MSYTITNDCINCQRCYSACLTSAIETNGKGFWIEVARCNQCQGSYGVPQYWSVCPTNEGCIPLASAIPGVVADSSAEADYWNSWFTTYTSLLDRLKASKQSRYWQKWFDTYADALTNLQTHAWDVQISY